MLLSIRLRVSAQIKRSLGLPTLTQGYLKVFSTSNALHKNWDMRKLKKQKTEASNLSSMSRLGDKDAKAAQIEHLDFGFKSQFDSGSAYGTKTSMTITFPQNAHRDVFTSSSMRTIPYIWLRDHCHCGECVNLETMQRKYDVFSAPRKIQPILVEFQPDGLSIGWNDGHQSLYKWSWLSQHVELMKPITDIRSQFWEHKYFGSEIKDCPPLVDYEEVMSSNQGVAKWMQLTHKHGFSYVDNCPVSPEKTQELLERICFIRQTHYGGFYDFTSDLTMKDTAYTAEALDAHTDTTYFSDPIGYQMFHLLSHTNGSGGESLLVDGFNCANILAKEDPEAFKSLVSISNSYHASGNEGISVTPELQRPVIRGVFLPGSFQFLDVRWNRYDRATFRSNFSTVQNKTPGIRSGKTVERWYDAAKKWNEILKRPENEYWEQLKPGRPLLFDNTRLLHGRSAFTGNRRICGGYLNRDDFKSRLINLHFTREQILESL